MPRILNLNDFAGKLIAIAAVLVTALPGLMYLLFLLLQVFQVEWPLMLALARGSVGLGLALFGLLIVLVIIEQIQDWLIVRQYDHNRAKRLPTADGLFESQYCGNRRVRPGETMCRVCGKDLQSPL